MPTNVESVPLSSLRDPKQHDFAALRAMHDELPDVDRDNLVNATPLEKSESDSTSETETEEDEFDWLAEDDGHSTIQLENEAKAKRGRRIWRAFMLLSRPFRVLIIAFLGIGILITPLLVFQLRFAHTAGHRQARMWSLWLAITWAAGCVTYLVVDLAPQVALLIIFAFTHRVQRLQISVEVSHFSRFLRHNSN